MKKRRFISIITVSLFILTLMTGCTSTNDQTTERTQSVNVEDQNSDSSLSTQNDWDDNTDTQTNSSSDLSQDEIRTIIEKHNSDLKGVNMTMELDSDDGIRVYDVTARTSTHKYEYEINKIPISSRFIFKYHVHVVRPPQADRYAVAAQYRETDARPRLVVYAGIYVERRTSGERGGLVLRLFKFQSTPAVVHEIGIAGRIVVIVEPVAVVVRQIQRTAAASAVVHERIPAVVERGPPHGLPLAERR